MAQEALDGLGITLASFTMMVRLKTLQHLMRRIGLSLPIFAAKHFYSGFRKHLDNSRRVPSKNVMSRRKTFVRLTQSRSGLAQSNCDTCHWLYWQGDLADEQGRTIESGGVPAEFFQCDLCPSWIMPDPDRVTVKANEVYARMAKWPYPEHPPAMEFIFKFVGGQSLGVKTAAKSGIVSCFDCTLRQTIAREELVKPKEMDTYPNSRYWASAALAQRPALQPK